MTEPPAGSAVMLSCDGLHRPGHGERGLLGRRAEQAQRDRLIAHDPPQLVRAAPSAARAGGTRPGSPARRAPPRTGPAARWVVDVEVDHLVTRATQGGRHRARSPGGRLPAGGSRPCGRPGPARCRGRRPRPPRPRRSAPTVATAPPRLAPWRRAWAPGPGRHGRATAPGCSRRGIGGTARRPPGARAGGWRCPTTDPRAAPRPSCPGRPPPRASRRARPDSAGTSSRCASTSVDLVAVHGVEGVGPEQFAGLVVRDHTRPLPDAGVDQDGPHATHAVADPALDRALGLAQQVAPPHGRCGRRSRPARWPGAPRRAANPWRWPPDRPRPGPRPRAACRRRTRRFEGVPGLTEAARVRRTDGIDGSAVGLGQQEGAQGAPGGVEAVGLVPEAEEDLLGDVLGLGGVVQHPLGQAEDGPAVAPVHLGQGHLAVASDGGDELGVTDLVQVLHMHVLFGTAPHGGCEYPHPGIACAPNSRRYANDH